MLVVVGSPDKGPEFVSVSFIALRAGVLHLLDFHDEQIIISVPAVDNYVWIDSRRLPAVDWFFLSRPFQPLCHVMVPVVFAINMPMPEASLEVLRQLVGNGPFIHISIEQGPVLFQQSLDRSGNSLLNRSPTVFPHL